VDRVAVYGRQAGEPIYELVAMAGETADTAWIADYEAGLDHYAARQWDAAIAAFDRTLAARPDDRAARLFRDRCSDYKAAPPLPGWDMVTRLDEK
ncbi:MAG: hypothetical protein JNM30_21265, partial [Rhodospirillales bacterium]|nr:hypothetical protein [Rhodospirillales bacterium]